MAPSAPPLWLIAAAQASSAIGDAIGQRIARYRHKGSRRRMLLSASLTSALQVFCIGLVIELAMSGQQGPLSAFVAVFYTHPVLLVNGVIGVIFYSAEISLYAHPLGQVLLVAASLSSALMLAPLQAAAGEKDSAGNDSTVWKLIPWISMGAIGALMCVVEVPERFWIFKKHFGVGVADEGSVVNYGASAVTPGSGAVANDSDDLIVEDVNNHQAQQPIGSHDDSGLLSDGGEARPLLTSQQRDAFAQERLATALWRSSPRSNSSSNDVLLQVGFRWGRPRLQFTTLSVVVSFVLVAVTYAVWFVLQKYVDEEFGINAFGYLAIDQVLQPFYMWPWLGLVTLLGRTGRDVGTSREKDTSPPWWRRPPAALLSAYERDETERGDSLTVTLSRTWQETSVIEVFLYRLLINARAVVYFYLAVNYDLTLVYVELTLVKVVFSWFSALMVVVVAPEFIRTSKYEQAVAIQPIHVLLKVFGTAAVLTSLIFLNSEKK